MQILAHNPEIRIRSDETGDYIDGFLIGTKLNDAKWKINKRTGHDLVQKFIGKDFAIIPELITKPLSEGGGGHYFGQDTKDDLLKGYADNSHGKYHKILGPYSYNDGTDDYFYNAIIKLRNSKAASELVKHGAKTWVPYSISPHIWPLAGPDHDIYDWEPIGGALVIKGAYGTQAVISKLCKGTAAQCEKSLGASSSNTIPCEKKDEELAQSISSLVGKTASIQTSMAEKNEASAAPVTTPQITTLNADTAKPNTNTTVDSQTAITNASITKIVTPEQFSEVEKRNQELEKRVTDLMNKDKINTLSNLFIKVKDEKTKDELIKKYSKFDNVDQIKEIITELYPILRASEEEEKEKEKPDEEKPADEGEKPLKAEKKGKSASLPKEPSLELPKEETTESKAASVPVNKLQEILRFQMSGGRA